MAAEISRGNDLRAEGGNGGICGSRAESRGRESPDRGSRPSTWLVTLFMAGRATFLGPPRNRISTCTLVDCVLESVSRPHPGESVSRDRGKRSCWGIFGWLHVRSLLESMVLYTCVSLQWSWIFEIFSLLKLPRAKIHIYLIFEIKVQTIDS